MARKQDAAKVEVWRQRLARFAESQQTVVQFCLAECVSVPSYYIWRKRLADDAADVDTEHAGQRRSTERTARASTKSGNETFDPPRAMPQFVPIAVQSLADGSTGRSTLVRLPHGIDIQLGTDLTIVKTVMRQLLRAASAVPAAEARTC